jgi:hypothetical protein
LSFFIVTTHIISDYVESLGLEHVVLHIIEDYVSGKSLKRRIKYKIISNIDIKSILLMDFLSILEIISFFLSFIFPIH